MTVPAERCDMLPQLVVSRWRVLEALVSVRICSVAMVLLAACTAQVGELPPTSTVEDDAGVAVIDAGDVVDAGVIDAGVVIDAGIDAGIVDAGSTLTHVVIAAGWGGRRVRSCDDGATWGASVQEADESADDWHKSYTPKSLTFGAGKFVFLTGWGTASTAWVSSDGASWNSSVLTTTYGGIGFSDNRFVLVGNRNIASADSSATGWAVDMNVDESMYDRATAAFDGIWAAGSDGNLQVKRSGQAWQSISACTGTRHTSIGFNGGFAAGNGRLISIGDSGDVCVVNATTGVHVGNSSLGGNAGLRVVFDGTQFLEATGDRLLRSSDGMTWASQSLPSGVRFDLVTRSTSGRLIGVSSNGRNAWFSDNDGTSWTASSNFPSGNGLLYVASGDLSTCR